MKSHFEVMQMPRAYHLDRAELERRYLALSKELHPDRFAKAPPRERLMAVQSTTALNDAYRVLKNDVKRAEYLLKLEGIDLSDERGGGVKAEPAFLMEMMELNEAAMEAKAASDTAKMAQMDGEMRARKDAALQAVSEDFKQYEAGDKSRLSKIAEELIAVRYYDRFLQHGEELD